MRKGRHNRHSRCTQICSPTCMHHALANDNPSQARASAVKRPSASERARLRLQGRCRLPANGGAKHTAPESTPVALAAGYAGNPGLTTAGERERRD
ncbi:hypothetical protein BD289DRAFT_79043 [Coniella lustricola]|uniref:Uncharacterized protein n=1 Tax=Coniella lustricola TaxID=2025994 RepID=A0A2T2ZZ74_9PEZI|nr:hypothetical protein BD289DRAFT_79043 [Coniella lustricola]